jgi:hypothetical protein
MSEPAKAGNPSEGEQKVDLTQYVPKGDFEKVSGSVKELQTQLEEAKMALLDPDYISFLESKKGKQVVKKAEKAVEKISDEEIDGLSSKQLLNLAVERAKEAILSEVSSVYDEQIKRMGATLSDVLGILELQEVREKHKDFDLYRDETRKILESSTTPLTIEQAYKIAKNDNPEKKPVEENKEGKAKAGTEKPSGTIARETVTPKTFKSKSEALEDAWNNVVGSGKDVL